MKPDRRVITDQTIRKALVLAANGLTLKDAAKAVGISHCTLQKRAHEVGYRSSQKHGWQSVQYVGPTDLAERGYIAGLLDGEGTICRTNKRQWQVSIINTHAETINWLGSFGGRIHQRLQRAGSLGRKPIYVWYLFPAHDVLRFLEMVRPYMRIKQHQAHAAIAELTGIIDQRLADIEQDLAALG